MMQKFPTVTKKEILNSLSSREQEILLALAKGYSRKDIAENFSISVLTYDEHRKNIKNKLGIKNNADWAIVLTCLLPLTRINN
ncbi:response regulator transcription factor [Roseivirga sp.]|uniref:response regulator transcription factor n=1 Tax=Roseivirga sp. TaxID=1964215 RepID=UPI003B8E8072